MLLACWLFYFTMLFASSMQFHDISFEEMNSQLLALKSDFAVVASATSMLPTKGECSPLIARITHHGSLAKDPLRPQLVISGEIHGNERVGPLASLYLAQLLVWSAQCSIARNISACSRLAELHVSSQHIHWMAYLVTRRDIFIIPTTNCYGYIHNDRADEGPRGHHDPNRDYPYSRRDANCLQTNSALILHSLFAKHTIQLLVTFHGGMAAIAYEWGTPTHPHPRDASPDDLSHAAIAHAMRDFAGKFNGESLYPVGTMNSLVYPVDGGLEDWAYAAGWDTGAVHNCSDNANTRVSNRAVVFLVETAAAKTPPTSAMGQDDYVLSSIDEMESHGGHVPRNTRLGLLAVDVMQPYLCVSGVETKSGDTAAVEVEWYIGGSQVVQEMWLSWHNASGVSTNDLASGRHLYDEMLPAPQKPEQPVLPMDIAELIRTEGSAQASAVMQGKARWSTGGDALQPPRYSASAVLPILPDGSHTLHLHVWAAVDCDWSKSGQGHPLNTPPQAHLSNTRCNQHWKHRDASGILRVQGKKYYASDPIVVTIKVSYGRVVSVSEKHVADCKWWEADYSIIPPADSHYNHDSKSTAPPIPFVEEPQDKVFIQNTIATERYFLYMITLVVVAGALFVVFQTRLRNRFLRLLMPTSANTVNATRAQDSLRSTVRHYEV